MWVLNRRGFTVSLGDAPSFLTATPPRIQSSDAYFMLLEGRRIGQNAVGLETFGIFLGKFSPYMAAPCRCSNAD